MRNLGSKLTNVNNWMVLALLAVAITAAGAQQSAPVPQNSQPVAATQPAQTGSPASPAQPNLGPPTTMDQVVDRVILREKDLIKYLTPRTPVVETYLQDLTQDPQLGPVPQDDHYFLGRMDFSETIDRSEYVQDDGKVKGKDKEDGMEKRLLGGFTKRFKFQYQPLGFSWMVFADRTDFDRQHYDFHYARREFLGDVRCLVFDLTPKEKSGRGRFIGRIWVEDQEFSIVRLNGTYLRPMRNNYYFHMDSWRLNLIPGYWIPAYIYSEEGDFTAGAKNRIAFKAQTRMWGYNLKTTAAGDELTNIRVDSVKDDTPTAQDATPLAAERQWQQQAEDNVVDRLQNAGLLAPEGDVDKILQTVVNNLEITNNIDLPRPVRTRVLTTSPLETFSVGNTIVVSRGLIDVLPDEGSLAMVLSHELAHIVLGHNLGSQYAFSDRMLFSDEATYQNFGFKHIPEEEAAADKKALDMLKASPYGQKLESAGLFIKALQARSPQLSALLQAHLGNNISENGTVTRMASLATGAPALDWNKLDQIAALPLGGRVKLNPWDDKVEIVKAQPVAITSARDKMPFEVTPFYPRLSRYTAPGAPAGNVAAAPATTATTASASPSSAN
ncbi:MAG: M48 family metalloprotease [Terriglobales bacterium]